MSSTRVGDHRGSARTVQFLIIVLRISQPYPGDLFSVIAVIGCRESRPCKMLRAIHFSPLPCSDLGQGVAISTTAFMLPRFFVQTHIFSVSPSSFSL